MRPPHPHRAEMEETLDLKPPSSERSQNEQDTKILLLQSQLAITTENMGRPYRTPSPAREGYISSSNVNSPSGLYQRSAEVETVESAFTPTGTTVGQRQKTMANPPRRLDASTGEGDFQQNSISQQTEKLNAFFVWDNEEVGGEIEAPKTPTGKHVPVPWHGLLSPQTPGFEKYSPKTPDTWLRDDTIGSFTSELPSDFIVGDIPLHDVFTDANHCLANGATRAMSEISAKEPNQTSPRPYESSSDADATTAKHKNGYDSKVIENDVERDEIFARHLDERQSPMPMRRSARLRVKQKSNDISQPNVTAPRPTRSPHSDEEPTAQPEVTVVVSKSSPIPFGGLPNVHSLSWQLQYPPGGSTHPSYPYPLLDPRLIFHQRFVPVIDGLPDTTHVPKLVLPMNWKHVSWSGLLPIVFDPYHQAFKLTPVGPLPLTCEELHQGGLHKHVPGGELHPEYGMLPDMLKLSDGSNAEVFNFDGVDWKLPWEGQLDSHAPSASGTGSNNTSNGTAGSSTSNAFDLESICLWREARDCPDGIIDLDDGWRWLSTKETDPATDFVPTPGKSRHGTGAPRSARKLKSPIPELMMLALQAEEPASLSSSSTPNPILQNQDKPTRGKASNLFCSFKSVATPVNVDITLLGEMEFTIIELLCFFPQHYHWRHASDRLRRAGMTPSFIRNMICMARALDGETAPKLSTISSAATNARKRDVTKHDAIEEVDIVDASMGRPSPSPTALLKYDTAEDVASYTAEGWTYDVYEKIDYPLLALAHGLQTLPSGVDAGPLTTLILWCRENGRYRVLLSDVPVMLKMAGIEPLIEPGEGECPDKEVTGRYAEALKKDRRRAKESKEAGKRAMEESAEGSSKRMKAD